MTTDALRPILKSQLHASLAMLKDAIEKCPDDVWLDERFGNRYWQIAYHTVFYAHMPTSPRSGAGTGTNRRCSTRAAS